MCLHYVGESDPFWWSTAWRWVVCENWTHWFSWPSEYSVQH